MKNTMQRAEKERIGDILERIRQEETPAVKGRRFEDLFMTVARELPEFEVEKIWTWQDWPGRQAAGLDAVDMGVDLVAHLVSGDKVAIQCKCYGEGSKVTKKDVADFIAASEGLGVDLRWVVATSEYDKGAEAFIDRPFDPEVRRINFLEYRDRTIQGIKDARKELRTPYDLQQRAIDRVVRGFKEEKHSRGRLIMACGTGKTFVSLRASERLVSSGGLILFAAPTISLVSQARTEWLSHKSRPVNAVVVCSDRTAGGRADRSKGYTPGVDDLVCPVVTKADALAQKLLGAPKNAVRVVFVTYHSLQTIIEAQTEYGLPAFDLAIADEAHRTTGADTGADAGEKRSFQHFHERLEADRRLYMTATERIYKEHSKARAKDKGLDVVDMGDIDIYGPRLHQVKFKEGVAAGRLSDYRVIVLGIDESYLTPAIREALAGEGLAARIDETDLLRLYGAALALNGFVRGPSQNEPLRLQRTLAFATTTRRSRWYAGTLEENVALKSQITRRLEGDARSMKVSAQALDNSHSALQRHKALRWLNDAPKANESRMICNVRLFAEGVDVPALDAVAFLDPKASQIDIVQAVGRVMRRAPGKKYGYVIVPVAMAGDDNLLETLEKRDDGYRAIGQVLRALQSHDERLAEQQGRFLIACEARPDNQAPTGEDSPDNTLEDSADLSRELQMSLNLEPVSADSIYAQLVSMSGLESPGQATATNITHTVQVAAGYFAKDAGLLNNAGAVLEMPPPQNDKERKEISTLTALLIANACLLHKRLQSASDELSSLADLSEVSLSREPIPALVDAWKKVLARDYEPIFRPALSLLEKLPHTEATAKAICAIAECAVSQADTLNELGYDHAGPLYHRILGSAESDGAFYTKNISALMLAGLALSPEMVDWSDTKAVTGLRVLDPACGTGTLLMAALKTIKDRVDAADPNTELSVTQRALLHKRLVEGSIMGLDINYHATQLAASNLTLGAPSVDYDAMHIHTMKHGLQPGGTVALGSLELLPAAVEGAAPDLFGHTKQTGAAALDRESEQSLNIKDVDVILTNPPFTNNLKRAAKFSKVQEKMRERDLAIKRHVEAAIPDAAKVIDSNNGSTFFTPLVDALLRPDRGVLGQVLPTTALTAASGIAGRKFLAARFHIDLIVTCHEYGQPNFSINTGIHESLLVCRRRQTGEPDKPTRFIALNHMPCDADEAADWLAAVHAGRPHDFHQVFEWDRQRIAAGDWTPAQFYDGGLAEAARELASYPSLAPLEETAVLGPAGQAVRPSFKNPLKSNSCAPPPPKYAMERATPWSGGIEPMSVAPWPPLWNLWRNPGPGSRIMWHAICGPRPVDCSWQTESAPRASKHLPFF